MKNYNYVIVFILSNILACGPITQEQLKTGGTGAGIGTITGVAATKVIDKANEVLTPHYNLIKFPYQICAKQGEGIICTLVPCVPKEKCQVSYTIEDFIAEGLENTAAWTARQASAIIEYCSKTTDVCIEYGAQYEGYKILIIKD